MRAHTTLVLLLFGWSFTSCYKYHLREYFYVNLENSWFEAQSYCREKYTDLATFESSDDVSRLKSPFLYQWAWIGMSDLPKSWKENMGNDSNSWRSSATGETSKTGYKNWYSAEPNNYDAREPCGCMVNGKWNDAPCSSLKKFVCYTDINQSEKTYVLISLEKTWKDAQTYCREHHTDLPMIESSEENNAVYYAAGGAYVWIGIYRVPWTWSDQTKISFTSWPSNSPENYGGAQFCVAENPEHRWNDLGCGLKIPFVCHIVSTLQTVVKLKIRTGADITNAATNDQILQQLGAVLKTQGWTHFSLQWKIQPRKHLIKPPSGPSNPCG